MSFFAHAQCTQAQKPCGFYFVCLIIDAPRSPYPSSPCRLAYVDPCKTTRGLTWKHSLRDQIYIASQVSMDSERWRIGNNPFGYITIKAECSWTWKDGRLRTTPLGTSSKRLSVYGLKRWWIGSNPFGYIPRKAKCPWNWKDGGLGITVLGTSLEKLSIHGIEKTVD